MRKRINRSRSTDTDHLRTLTIPATRPVNTHNTTSSSLNATICTAQASCPSSTSNTDLRPKAQLAPSTGHSMPSNQASFPPSRAFPSDALLGPAYPSPYHPADEDRLTRVGRGNRKGPNLLPLSPCKVRPFLTSANKSPKPPKGALRIKRHTRRPSPGPWGRIGDVLLTPAPKDWDPGVLSDAYDTHGCYSDDGDDKEDLDLFLALNFPELDFRADAGTVQPAPSESTSVEGRTVDPTRGREVGNKENVRRKPSAQQLRQGASALDTVEPPPSTVIEDTLVATEADSSGASTANAAEPKEPLGPGPRNAEDPGPIRNVAAAPGPARRRRKRTAPVPNPLPAPPDFATIARRKKPTRCDYTDCATCNPSPENADSALLHDEGKPIYCTWCDRLFHDRTEHQDHLLEAPHYLTKDGIALMERDPEDPAKVLCRWPGCDEGLGPDSSSLKKHTTDKHTPVQIRHGCGKWYSNTSAYARHSNNCSLKQPPGEWLKRATRNKKRTKRWSEEDEKQTKKSEGQSKGKSDDDYKTDSDREEFSPGPSVRRTRSVASFRRGKQKEPVHGDVLESTDEEDQKASSTSQTQRRRAKTTGGPQNKGKSKAQMEEVVAAEEQNAIKTKAAQERKSGQGYFPQKRKREDEDEGDADNERELESVRPKDLQSAKRFRW